MRNESALVTIAVLFVLALVGCVALLVHQMCNDLITMYAEETFAAIGRVKLSEELFLSLEPAPPSPDTFIKCHRLAIPSGKLESSQELCVQIGDSAVLNAGDTIDLSGYSTRPLIEVGLPDEFPCGSAPEPAGSISMLGTTLTPSSFKANATCSSAPSALLGKAQISSNLSTEQDISLGGEIHVLGYCEAKGNWQITQNLLLICAGDIIINSLFAPTEINITLVSMTGSILVKSVGELLNLRAIAASGLFLPAHSNPGKNHILPRTRDLIVIGS